MRQLPDSVSKYKETPHFTSASVPAGLLKDHKTKEGVWGRIVVIRGDLLYQISRPNGETESHRLSPEVPGIVEPAVPHRVTLEEGTVFKVEFYRS